MTDSAGPRLLLQYLEPSPAVDAAVPSSLREHLAATIEQLPVTDLALGWRLAPEVIEAVLSVIPGDVSLWRWVPVFVDSGSHRAADAHVAVGPSGVAPPPFRDMADFRFLCLDQDEVVSAGLERATELAREIDASGVLLDRIRWHSPSQSPVDELTCFCAHSRVVATHDGLDLEHVATELGDVAASLDRRRAQVAMLLGRRPSGPAAEFMAWRSATVTRAVARLAGSLRKAGLKSALDVFTPSLAGSVGQDLSALSEHGQWSKSMTYLDAIGPASMPFELRGYAAWLEAAGDDDAAGFLADLLGFEAPGLGVDGPQINALRTEALRLSSDIGAGRSIVGIDAVEIPGVSDVAEADLTARVRALRDEGVGLSPCWELLFISGERVANVAAAWRP
jgi:hypothetical protein